MPEIYNNIHVYSELPKNKNLEYQFPNGQAINISIPHYDHSGSRFFPSEPTSDKNKLGRFFYNNVHPPKYGWKDQLRNVTNTRYHIYRQNYIQKQLYSYSY